VSYICFIYVSLCFSITLKIQNGPISEKYVNNYHLNICLCCFQLQELILSGELPCSKDEAATLAGIQLHLEDAWPENEMTNHNGPFR